MSQIVPQVSSPYPVPSPDDRLRRICLLDYGLHIVGLLFSAGLLSVVALIINYIKRDDARAPSMPATSWMISSSGGPCSGWWCCSSRPRPGHLQCRAAELAVSAARRGSSTGC
jgi:uncharacterized membrane protein